jgi:hypothetical protein
LIDEQLSKERAIYIQVEALKLNGSVAVVAMLGIAGQCSAAFAAT